MLKKLNFKVSFCLFFLMFGLTPLVIAIQAEESEISVQTDVPISIRDKNKLRFATWNIENLGRKVRGECGLKTIARILNKYDFIAIVELMPGDVKDKKDDGRIVLEDDSDLGGILKRIRKKYGREFKYLISPKVGWKGSSYKEHYAFIYDEDLIAILPDSEGSTNGSVYHEPIERPEDRMEETKKFSRSPFWATFRAGNFDFTVIVAHLYYGNVRNEKQRSLAERRLEIKALKGVYDHVRDRVKQEKDILVVGDFNMPAVDASFDALKDAENSDQKMTPLFLIDNGDVSNLAGTPYLYDNIFLNQKHVQEYLDSCIDKFHLTYFDGNKREATLISNHLPVTAEFRINAKDDD